MKYISTYSEDHFKVRGIKIGKILHWDAKGLLTSIHQGTTTVKILGFSVNGLVRWKSVQTGEISESGSHMLQPNPNRLKSKYNNILKRAKRGFIDKRIHEVDEIFPSCNCWINSHNNIKRQIVVLAIDKDHNQAIYLSSRGLIDSCDLAWIPSLKHLASEAVYAKRQEVYDDDCYMDWWVGLDD